MPTLPTALFPGYEYVASGETVAANSIVIPLSALGGLSASEASATTGDGRKVAFELNKALLTNFQALPTKPTRMTITESTPTGVNATTIRKSFTHSYDLAVGDVDVADEPA
jgi:hypothetical protein